MKTPFTECKKMLEHLLTKFSEELSLPLHLKKDKEEYFSLPLNKDMTFYLKELKPGFSCKATIVDTTEGLKEELYILLLKANYLGQGTAGSYIGMDEKEKHFLLFQSCRKDVNLRQFKEVLEEFANYLEYWRNKIQMFKKSKAY